MARPYDRNVTLRLLIFDTIRDPNRRYTYHQLSDATGVSRSCIWRIEQRALAKLRKHARQLLND